MTDPGRVDSAFHPTKLTVARALVVLGAACLVQAVVLYHAVHYGVLSGLVQWDDCLVILRGLENLEIITAAKSAYAIARSVPYLNIHAPLSDVQAMAGLLFSGGAVLGPFVLNVVPVLLALYAIFYRPDRVDGWLFAAILMVVLVQPLTVNALTYVKADWKGAPLIAAAAFALNEGAERRSVRLKLVGATVLGVGLTSKLTAFYYPVLAVAILVAFEAYEWILTRKLARRDADDVGQQQPSRYGWRDARVLLACIAIAVLPYALSFLVYFQKTLTYIRYALGAEWTDGLTAVQRATYYSPAGGDGAAAWGRLHIVFAIFAVACVGVAIARKTYGYLVSLACALVLAILFLTPLVVAKTSGIEYAAGLMGIILGATIIAMCTFARAFPRWGGLAALVITIPLVLRVPLPLSPTAYRQNATVQVSELRALESAYERIEGVLETSIAPKPRVLVFFENVYAPHPNLSIRHFQRTGRLLSVSRVDDMSELQSTNKKLAGAEFALTYVVAGVDSIVGRQHGLSSRFPLSVHPGVADAFLAAQPDFERVHSELVPGGEIHVYRNSSLGNRLPSMKP